VSSGAGGGVPGIVGVLLAAGGGARFGGNKLAAPLPAGPWAGLAVAIAACRNLRSAVDVVAVVRADDEALATSLAREGARIVVARRAAEGMGASLAAGVAAAGDAEGYVVALADMPWVAPATIRVVADALAGGASIVAPRFRGRRGHPVGFAAAHRDALVALGGDEGARSLLAAHAGALRFVDVDDPGVLRDVDVPEDLR
jgi:molybdenum cofactor cytidylyltransferase